MNDDAERLILGDAVAAASESAAPRRRWFGGKRRADAPLTHCQNCGALLAGSYCAQCGQHAIDYRRSFGRVFVDAADSIFNWDTKFLRTMGVLLAKPSKLTNDFNAGRRVRYVHPLRLYLLASIAFFLAVKLVNLSPRVHSALNPKDRAELDAALAKLAAPESPLKPEQRAKIEAARARWSQITGPLESDEQKELDAAVERVGEAIPSPDTAGEPLTKAPPQVSTHWEEKQSPFGKWMTRRIKEKIGDHGSNAKLFLETLRNNVPTMMLCCIPLFAFVLKILYVFQRRFYVEHLVYALHVHTFTYVGVVAITLLAMVAARWAPTFETPLILILSLGLAVQVFLSIRRVYGQGWFMTTSKFLLGGIVYLFVLAMALSATAFVTLLLP